MPADEGAGGSAVDPVETADDLLRDERRLAVRDSGVIVTHVVTAVGDGPVRFQLVDPLPSKFDVGEIDFDPAYEPQHGRIDAHAAVVSGVVEPGREVVVRYGLRPTEPGRPTAVEALQRETPPSIELSEPVDADETEGVDLDAASMPRGEGAVGSEDAATEGFYFGIKRLMFGADADEAPPAATAGEGRLTRGADRPDPDSAGDADGEEEAGDEADAEGEESPDARIPGGDPFGGTNEDTSLAASISEIESTVDRSGPDEDEPADDGEPDDETRPFREFFEVREEAGPAEAPDSAPEGRGDAAAGPEAADADDGPGADATRHEVDVVDEFVRRLESGDLSDEQRRALGEALSDALATAERPSKSTEVRLRELESKLEEFAVYSSALKELIDVHGPADEFLADVREDIEALSGAVDELRGDLAGAAKSRAGLDDRLEEAADEVALLDSRVKRLRNRVDDVEVTHESEVGALEAEVEALESELDRLDRLESDLEALRRAVEDGRARRRAVVEALREDEPTGE